MYRNNKSRLWTFIVEKYHALHRARFEPISFNERFRWCKKQQGRNGKRAIFVLLLESNPLVSKLQDVYTHVQVN